eukprot:GFYU01000745.1.p1 GENE.GFYU01000745.1~~GFYU01000745.1.p1  ORF type:complete len:467 (-),score=138.59 GFYU01000745.1:19-1419(-)
MIDQTEQLLPPTNGSTRGSTVTVSKAKLALVFVAVQAVCLALVGTVVVMTVTPTKHQMMQYAVNAINSGEITTEDTVAVLEQIDTDILTTTLLDAAGSKFSVLTEGWVLSDTLTSLFQRDLAFYAERVKSLVEPNLDVFHNEDSVYPTMTLVHSISSKINELHDIPFVVGESTPEFAYTSSNGTDPHPHDGPPQWSFISGLFAFLHNQLQSPDLKETAEACVALTQKMQKMDLAFRFYNSRGEVSGWDGLGDTLEQIRLNCHRVQLGLSESKDPSGQTGQNSVIFKTVTSWLNFNYKKLFKSVYALANYFARALGEHGSATSLNDSTYMDVYHTMLNVKEVAGKLYPQFEDSGEETGLTMPFVGNPLSFVMDQGDQAKWKEAGRECWKYASKLNSLDWSGSYEKMVERGYRRPDCYGYDWECWTTEKKLETTTWDANDNLRDVSKYMQWFCAPLAKSDVSNSTRNQ